MSKEPNDDLFGDSTMSFGEHLEELRGALFRAIAGIVIGVAVGLLFAGSVVDMIKDPLEKALEEYYQEKAKTDIDVEYATASERKDAEYEAASQGKTEKEKKALMEKKEEEKEALMKEAEEAKAFMTTNHYVYEEVYFERTEAIRIAKGEKIKEGASLPPPSADLIKLRLWRRVDSMVSSLSAHEAFMIWLKAALITGVVLSSPWAFYQIWMFVAAGLYPHEQRYIHVFLPFSLILFLSGAGLAFFFVFQHVLKFLFSFNAMMNIDPDPRISEWLSFVLFMPVGFGISFQLPLVMLFLHRIGIFTPEAYIKQWRIAILVIFVVSMLLTPADPISMLMMAVPLTLLYFGGIGLCKWMPASRSPYAEPEEM